MCSGRDELIPVNIFITYIFIYTQYGPLFGLSIFEYTFQNYRVSGPAEPRLVKRPQNGLSMRRVRMPCDGVQLKSVYVSMSALAAPGLMYCTRTRGTQCTAVLTQTAKPVSTRLGFVQQHRAGVHRASRVGRHAGRTTSSRQCCGMRCGPLGSITLVRSGPLGKPRTPGRAPWRSCTPTCQGSKPLSCYRT